MEGWVRGWTGTTRADGARCIHFRFYEKIVCDHLFFSLGGSVAVWVRSPALAEKEKSTVFFVASAAAAAALCSERRIVVAAAMRADLACGSLILLAAATARNPRVHRTRTGR